jgi:hypothetical protein
VKNSHTSSKQIAYQQKLAQALDLRRQGYDFDVIAAQMKTSRTTAHRWVVRARRGHRRRKPPPWLGGYSVKNSYYGTKQDSDSASLWIVTGK